MSYKLRAFDPKFKGPADPNFKGPADPTGIGLILLVAKSWKRPAFSCWQTFSLKLSDFYFFLFCNRFRRKKYRISHQSVRAVDSNCPLFSKVILYHTVGKFCWALVMTGHSWSPHIFPSSISKTNPLLLSVIAMTFSLEVINLR